MSIIKRVEAALQIINQATFQDLMNHLLHVKGYKFISAPGSVVGKEKTSKGIPDSFFVQEDKYVFVECTTQERIGGSKSFYEKLLKDIESCFDTKKTKIPKTKIDLVILACTEKINPAEYDSLNEKISNHNPDAKLELYSIQNLPILIYDFPGLSEQYLGVEIVKGEIYNLPDFLTKTTKGLQPSLTNEFVGREDELKKANEYLSSSDILLLSGAAGVGKSKMAIAILEDMAKQNFIPIVIQSSAVPLWDDFVNLFQNGKNYIILFDDANKSVQNLAYLLDFIQKPKPNILKVVITSRDYVKQQVSLKLSDSRYKEIVVDSFKDKEIEEIIIKALPNLKHYPDIKKQIVELAKGNARVALMATYSVVPDSEINYLSSPVKLYEKYFEKIAQEIDVFSKPIMLQALAIVSFFGVIDRKNEQLEGLIKTNFDIDWGELWDAIIILHSHEVLNVHEKEIVKVADQVLGTYAFYKCFIDNTSTAIDYGKWITVFIHDYSHRIKASLIDTNNTFNYHHVKELTLPHLNMAMTALTDEKALYSFHSLFWFYKGYDTLNFIRNWIQQLPVQESPGKLEFTYVHNDHTHATGYFELLVNFWNHPDELIKPALQLGIELAEKQPSRVPEFLKFINDYFSYKVQDLENGYLRQNILLDVLLDTNISPQKKRIADGTFLNISEKLLGWHFTEHGSTKGRTFTFTNFDLFNSPELLQLRERILEGFLSLFHINEHQSAKILEKIVRPDGDIDKQIYVNELSIYERLVSEKLGVKKYAHCKFVKRLSKKLSETGVEYPKQWESFINSDILKLSTFLKTELDDVRGKSIDEREKEKREEFENFVKEKSWEQIESALFSIEELYKQQPDYSKWYVDAAITDIYIAIARKGKHEFEKALRIFFSGALSLPLQPRVLHFVINENIMSGKELVSIMNSYKFLGKPYWTTVLLNVLPESQADFKFLELLINTFKDSSDPLPIYRMKEFVKFKEEFDNYKQNIQKGIESTHNVISYITEILLSKKELHRVSLGFEFCQECSPFFTEHVALFKEAYIYLKSQKDHFDYEGKELKAVLDLDNNFFTEYLNSDSVTFDYLSFKLEDFQLDYIWSLEEYETIIKKSIGIIIGKVPHFSNMDHPVAHLFTFKKPNDELHLKALTFIEDFINKHHDNKQCILVIMNVVMHRFPDQFVRFLKQFFMINKDIGFLKSMYLHKGGVYSGSRIPHIQQEIDFCNEVINMIKTLPGVLDYSNHIKYLEQKIGWLKQDKAMEQKRDFQEEYY